MRFVVAGAVGLAFASSLGSQVLATVRRSPAGVPELSIRNGGRVGLAAFAVVMNPIREAEDQSQLVVFFDAVVDGTPPLESEQAHTLPVLLRSRPGQRLEDRFQMPALTAGILVDGTTTGDPVLLHRLMLRRSNMLLAVETALDTLAGAGQRNVPRDQLPREFRKLADSVWRWYVPPEQQAGRDVYRSVLEKLGDIPDPPPGSPFPPSAFVTEQTATLNRQRAALLQARPAFNTATVIRAR